MMKKKNALIDDSNLICVSLAFFFPHSLIYLSDNKILFMEFFSKIKMMKETGFGLCFNAL